MASATHQKIMDLVLVLVADDHRAVDFELGLCRFCSARVESSNPNDLETHRADCPWHEVRRELGLA